MGAIYFQGLKPSSGHLFLLIWDELEIWLKSQNVEKPKLEKGLYFFDLTDTVLKKNMPGAC